MPERHSGSSSFAQPVDKVISINIKINDKNFFISFLRLYIGQGSQFIMISPAYNADVIWSAGIIRIKTFKSAKIYFPVNTGFLFSTNDVIPSL